MMLNEKSRHKKEFNVYGIYVNCMCIQIQPGMLEIRKYLTDKVWLTENGQRELLL